MVILQGNFVAVGSFDPTIEIWDMDVIDPVYPHIILGSGRGKKSHQKSAKKSLAKKKDAIDPLFHTDHVMSISWNAITRFGFLL